MELMSKREASPSSEGAAGKIADSMPGAEAVESISESPKPKDTSAEQPSLPFGKAAEKIAHSAFGAEVVQHVSKGLVGFPVLFFAVVGAVADLASLVVQSLVLVGFAVAFALFLLLGIRSASLEAGPRRTRGVWLCSLAAIGTGVFAIFLVFQAFVGGSRGAIAGTSDDIASFQSTVFNRLGLIKSEVEEIGERTRSC